MLIEASFNSPHNLEDIKQMQDAPSNKVYFKAGRVQNEARSIIRCLNLISLVLKTAYSLSLFGLPLVIGIGGNQQHQHHVPNRHTVASVPGDLVIGVLIPVHERPTLNQAQTRTCGAVREQYGIQRVEAAFKTIDFINSNPRILPNITLGIEIRDSCWYSPIALEQSIEFIRDAMAASDQTSTGKPASPSPATSLYQQEPKVTNGLQVGTSASGNLSSIPKVCAPLLARQQQQLQASGAGKRVKNIVGVVGPASSGDTVQVHHLLQLFNMPQVGYSATSRDLSNKNFYKYFLRVVPSDKFQAQVILDLMMANNWTYITVVYTEGKFYKLVPEK